MARHDVVFQPIVHLSDWKVLGYEALARFEDGRAPNGYIAEARAQGRLIDLELELIATAIESAKALPGEHLVTLNASAETIVHPGLAELLAGNRTREWGIELSELSDISDYDEIRQAIRGLGAVLLIDDAGTRFADLGRVRHSAPSIVKVDQSIVHAATDVVPFTKTLREYREAATAVGALALAEGVESPAQARVLLEHGFDLGQGYLFGHPAPAESWVPRTI